jgi:catechol 2,3-dioxygenase-like lactoylglutathione lyase family enzyme
VTDPVESISAVTLTTADVAAAVAFYDALGFRRVSGRADAPFTTYRAAGQASVPSSA